MKNIILQLNIIRFLMIGVFFLLVNCQNEDYEINAIHETKTDIKIEKTSNFRIQEKPQLFNKIKDIKSKFVLAKNEYNKDVFFENHDFQINTEVCTYLENSNENYHSYTFPIIRTNSNDLLENLLISLQPDGSYKAFLVTYFFSEEQLEQVFNDEEIIGNYDFNFSNLEDISISDIFEKTTFNEQTGCWESITTYHTNSEGSWEYVGYCPHPDGYCSVTTTTSIFGCHNEGGGLSGSNDNDDGYNGNPGSSGGGLSNVTSITTCKDCPDLDDCPTLNEELVSQLIEVLGDGNFEMDCSLTQEEMINFNSVDELESYLDDLISSNFSMETSELDDQSGTLRQDILTMRISNFPRADIVSTIRVMVPEPNNDLECLDILNVRTNLEGNNTLFDWTQFDSESPADSNGPLVEVDEGLDRIKISVQGELQFGIKLGTYPAKARYLYTIIITYFYSTGEINPQYCYWIPTN